MSPVLWVGLLHRRRYRSTHSAHPWRHAFLPIVQAEIFTASSMISWNCFKSEEIVP